MGEASGLFLNARAKVMAFGTYTAPGWSLKSSKAPKTAPPGGHSCSPYRIWHFWTNRLGSQKMAKKRVSRNQHADLRIEL